MLTIRVTRGETLQLRLRVRDEARNPVNLAGWSVAASVRGADGLGGAFIFDPVDVFNGICDLVATDAITAAWPLGVLACDVRLRNPDGATRRTPKFQVQVDEPVTA